MLSALCWVPRGAAKAVPDRVQPSEEELRAMQAGAAQMGASAIRIMVLQRSAKLASACAGQVLPSRVLHHLSQNSCGSSICSNRETAASVRASHVSQLLILQQVVAAACTMGLCLPSSPDHGEYHARYRQKRRGRGGCRCACWSWLQHISS